jgi:aspartate aminotransferase
MLTANNQFTERIGKVSESSTTRIFTLANQMRQAGRRIISLSVGEPNFDTPDPIIRATCRALTDQVTRYGPVPGDPRLRERLAEAFSGYGPENIIITNGAKQALFALFQILCNDADEVIIPRPCWVSFTEQIKLAGGRPVLVDTIDGQIDPAAIDAAVGPRTRAILINSPNNPTGAVYHRDALTRVARIAADHHLYLIADEAYHAFTYDGRPHESLHHLTADPQRVITVRSFSKQYNMTGYRIGYVAADQSVVLALTRLQSHLCGNVCSFAQRGALAALEMDQQIVTQRRTILEQRRDMALAFTRALFECTRPGGAFYLFPDVCNHLKKNETSADLCMRLLEDAGVAVVPGEAFHMPGHIRISFGASEEDLQQGFEKIKEAL